MIVPELKAATDEATRHLPGDVLWPGNFLYASLRATEDNIDVDSFKECATALMGWRAFSISIGIRASYWVDATPGMQLLRVVDEFMGVLLE